MRFVSNFDGIFCVFFFQAQLLGESLYNYVCPEDHEELTKNFSFNDTQRNTTPALLSSDQLDESSNSSDDFPFKEEQRRSFSIRIAQRTVSRREHIQYECFHVSGSLCLANACRNAGLNVNRLKQRGTRFEFLRNPQQETKMNKNKIEICIFCIFIFTNFVFFSVLYFHFVSFSILSYLILFFLLFYSSLFFISFFLFFFYFITVFILY